MAWYNTYRPQSFADVSGQQLVKSVLENAIKSNKIKHGYLLSGPKGTGKTTLARIFANQLNGIATNPEARLDIIELDAASNTGVDSIRQLIESAKTTPFAGKYKIYIIDEVHMLSKSAMNALLKILEEPPQYLVFLLATTNPEKLLPTVQSRLTKLTLTSHTEQDIVDRLSFIATTEGMSINIPSLKIIAKRANGGQRDAINLLETLYSYGLESYDLTQTTALLGLLPTDILIQICGVLASADNTGIVPLIQKIEQLGIDGESFLAQALEFLLENSFLGDTRFDSLILPIAEILDLRLPINTVVSSVALVQVKLREKKTLNSLSNPNNNNLPQNLTQHQHIPNHNETFEITKETKQTQVIEKSVEKSDTDIMISVEANVGNSVETTIEKNIDINTIQRLILSVKDQPKFPAMSKIFWSKIKVESIQDNQLLLSLDSPMFVEKLKNPSNKKLILDYLTIKTGQNFSLDTMVRTVADNDSNTSKISNFDTNFDVNFDKETADNIDIIGQETKNSVYLNQEENKNRNQGKNQVIQASNVLNNTINKPNQKPFQKYFYSVYLNLPTNTVYGDIADKSIIPIWSENICSEQFIPTKTSLANPNDNNSTLEAFAEFGILD